jgi:hypothetical protein
MLLTGLATQRILVQRLLLAPSLSLTLMPLALNALSPLRIWLGSAWTRGWLLPTAGLFAWRHRALLAFALILSLGAVGCVELPDVCQVSSPRPVGEILGTRTVGQTFVASHDGLSRIDVQFATYGRRNTHPVIFHLRSDPDATTDIVTIAIRAQDIQDNAYRSFRFPAIADSAAKRFYFFLESPDSRSGDAITLWHSPHDMYTDGGIYIQEESQAGDLAFKTYYAYGAGAILADLASDVWSQGWVLVLAFLLYLLPGYALMSLTGLTTHRGLVGRLLLAPSLSLALMPLALYTLSPLGIRLGPAWTWGWLVLSAGIVTWRHRARLSLGRLRSLRWRRPQAAHVALIALLGLMLATRMWSVRGLVAPLWGDSYHHTMIAQLMVDHGGLFESWQPYAPLASFTYHFGFHASVAFLHWLTGLDVIRSVIYTGQLINTLAVLAMYPLAVRLSRGNRWAGVFAVLIGGFLSPMPMYYTNWGRYTQLTGQAILPVAMLLTWDALDQERRNYGLLVLAAIPAAGLALTHYRVLLFYVAFIPALLLTLLWQRRSEPHGRRDIAERMVLVGTCVFLIVLPWLWHSLRGLLPAWMSNMVRLGSRSRFVREEYNAPGRLADFTGSMVMAAGALGGLWGLVRKQRETCLVLTWILLLAILANPAIIGLPGAGVVSNFALLVAIYMPVSLLGGSLGSWATEWLVRKWGCGRYLIISAAMLLALWGGRERLSAVNEAQFALVTDADLQAMAWIRDNTPPEAKFLINSFPAYGDSIVVGSDGGWWIPLITMRDTTVPPATAYLEAAEEAAYAASLTALARELRGVDMDSSAVLSLLAQNHVTHVFVGQKQGRVNYTGNDVLDPVALNSSPYYHAVYHQDGVWIFEVTPTYYSRPSRLALRLSSPDPRYREQTIPGVWSLP